MSQQGIASRIARGVRLAGAWRVECVLLDDAVPSAVLARSDEGRRAVCFMLGHEPAPEVDPVAAAAWGISRSVVTDDEFGTIVVDALGLEARPLAAVESDSPDVARRVRDRVAEIARAEHRRGRAHGLLRRELVFATSGTVIHACGWGLSGSPGGTAACDLADVSVLVSGEDPGDARDSRALSLTAAVRSEDVETLRRAVAWGTAHPESAPEDELARARDALQRMEERIESCLSRAERQLDVRDPLGAVAACREAVRLGAGPRAERLLRRARRQAKELLAPPKRSRSLMPVAAVIAAAGLLVLAAAMVWLRADDSAALRDTVERVATERGERAAFQMLVAAAERSPADVEDAYLSERLARLSGDERQSLLLLRRDAIADGMRPRRADAIAEEAFVALDALADSIGHPAFSTRLARALARVDRAATFYRARTSLAADDAVRAVDQLVALDPAFVSEPGRRAGR